MTGATVWTNASQGDPRAISKYRQPPATHLLSVLAQPGYEAREKGARNLWMDCWEVTLLCH